MKSKGRLSSGKVGQSNRLTRARTAFLALLTVTMIAALMPFSQSTSNAAENQDLFPWQLADVLAPGVGPAPVGAGFEITIPDLTFILTQIKMAEAHVGPGFDPLNPCANLIGPGPNQIPDTGGAELLPYGLRTLNGICNNLVPGQENFGETDQPFIRLMTPAWSAAEDYLGQPTTYVPGTPNPTGPFGPFTPFVLDSQPRIISNLIVDQTINNPAAVAAAGPGAVPGPEGSFNIENVTPDEGLSMPFNATLTFFGQFFDHGLDLTSKNGELVYMPLQVDDPLFDPGPDMDPMTLGDNGPNFMLMGRAQLNDPAAEATNETSPFVDQNQTYSSSPSQQVFMREYVTAGVDPDGAGPLTATSPMENGRLLEGSVYLGIGGGPGGLTRWVDVKAQALNILGFELDDIDILSVSMMAADLYGNYIPGPARGMPMIITVGPDLLGGTADDVLVEGDLASPVSTAALNAVPATAVVPAGRAWLADIAHNAVPGPGLVPDTGAADTAAGCDPTRPGSQVAPFCDDGDPNTYDNEMLEAHFICGDGRCNENIALSAVHTVFHAEHNRVVEDVKAVLDASIVPPGDTVEALAFYEEWRPGGVWDGRRLFQAAKFITEIQYQQIAFDEFARAIQPQVNIFAGYDATIDARIFSEFANTAYRFGHTMLNETIERFDTDTGFSDEIGLIGAFLDPVEFFADDAGGFSKTPSQAAGGILAGVTTQVGQEIDEFIVEALRNELVGLPLDLAAINLARGRDTGVPRLNDARAQMFALTNSNSIYDPYESWFDFGFALKTPESLRNFVAAYGIYPDIQAATNNVDRRLAADIAMADSAFMTGPAALTGLDNVDLWVGGLAEKGEIFGGLLGSTLNFIFELQMENLQDGDRFYYLARLAGLPMLQQVEANAFAELIERNTSAKQLPANVFARPTYTFNLDVAAPVACGGLFDDPATPDWDESILLVQMGDCTVRYPGAEHVLFYGRTGAAGSNVDIIQSGEGDDTVRGNEGPDRLEGFGGNDILVGGAGNDIITDTFGDDDLRGGPGNDALHGGQGLDLLQGGAGKDFMVLGSDPGEVLAGSGDDFVQGGASFDIMFGGIGDDWIAGGPSADILIGDEASPFEDDPLGSDGNDVLAGEGGDDVFDAEGGDDIMIAGTGFDLFDGIAGYDWVTHKGDPQPADSDLERIEALGPGQFPLDDRFDMVEGLSGWMFDDVLRGDGLLPEIIIGDVDNTLYADGIARITNLDLLLPPGTTSITDSNIILGGGGSDLIEGREFNDIIDGDAWLNVQLEVGGIRYDNLTDLQTAVFDGSIDPGDITIIREILWEPPGTDIDTAEFDGLQADYDVTVNPNGSLQVVHARNILIGCPDIDSVCNDGIDTLFNIEMLAFADVTVEAPCATCWIRAVTSPPLPSQIVIDGVPRDRWGLNWMRTNPGTYDVTFTDVQGWTTPAPQTVQVGPGLSGFVEGVFTQNGFIMVETSPPVRSTITINGVPRDDWAVWTDVAPGSYEVCYGEVEGFDAPACETQNVTAGATTNFTGVFVADTHGSVEPTGVGYLRVNTTNSLGAGGIPSQISIDGVPADSWGLDWVKLVPGTYEVCFSDVEGFNTPACESAVVTVGNTTVVVGAFEARGTLRVVTSPPRASTIFVDGIPRNEYGMWNDLPVGPADVCFGPANGFTPPCEAVVLMPGVTTFVTGVWP